MALGAAIINRNLNVIGANPALATLLEQEQLNGRNIGELLTESDSWLDCVQAIRDILVNRHVPQFCMLVHGTLPSRETVHFHVNVVALLVARVAAEGEGPDVERIAMIITDYTDIMRAQREVEEQQQRLTAMLQRVIPAQLCGRLQSGAEALSVDAQSATVGYVKVVSNVVDEYHLLPKVFDEFDSLLEGFELLIKARTVFNTYIFAGGLLANTKAARHAEEAVRFALKLIVTANSIARHIGKEFTLLIGLHTGGPVISGIISPTRPTFQIIAPIMDCAAQMSETSMAGEVHITRSTYEHIFASGFKTRDRGEVPMPGGGSMVTYLVSPG
jgi:class 3 adenylate cyclase